MPPEPSPRLTRAATVVLLTYVGLASAVLLYGVLRILADPNPVNIGIWGIGPLLAIAGLAAAFRADGGRRLGLALLLLTSTGGVLAAEVALLLTEDHQPERAAARRLGQDFDGRSRLQVLTDMEDAGTLALPDLHGRVIVNGGTSGVPLRIAVNDEEVIPLAAAASLSDVVLCNEWGPWIRYRSDERGYRNPPGLWGRAAMDVVTVGDSFTMGLCMEDSDVPAQRIRQRWPATLNLGLPGAGPLLELASLKEFGSELSPRVVVWMFYEGNDLMDLPSEMDHPLLARYLEPGFRQGLDTAQAVIDEQIRTFMAALAALEDGVAAGPLTGGSRIVSVLKLERVRTVLGFSASLGPPEEAVPAFRTVLAQARQTAESWGGKMVFVYLPDYNRFALRGVGEDHLGRRDVLKIVDELGIPLVDLVPVFADHERPRSLWAYPGAHYTREGFDLLSALLIDAVAQQLDQPPVPTK